MAANPRWPPNIKKYIRVGARHYKHIRNSVQCALLKCMLSVENFPVFLPAGHHGAFVNSSRWHPRWPPNFRLSYWYSLKIPLCTKRLLEAKVSLTTSVLPIHSTLLTILSILFNSNLNAWIK